VRFKVDVSFDNQLQKGTAMKLPFTPPSGVVCQYCWNCGTDGVTAVTVEGQRLHYCGACGQTLPRALIVDPAVRWWVDDTNEYWHETAGVFVRRPDGRYLFFERTAHPLGLTVPAGHMAPDETAEQAAIRELHEEAGVSANHLTFIGTDDVVGDECRRGADAHRWHVFGLAVPATVTVSLNEEGLHPVWLSLAEAKALNLTHAVRIVIDRYSQALGDKL
jgi:8-oxo-dGTP pyrophosphatase MutT (NUDIX family)